MRALVRDPAAARTAFGPYVVPVQGDSGDAAAVRAAVAGSSCIVATGRLPQPLPSSAYNGRVVLLSCVGAEQNEGFLGRLLRGSGAAVLWDSAREAAVQAAKVAYAIVRAPSIDTNVPGGKCGLQLGTPLGSMRGSIR